MPARTSSSYRSTTRCWEVTETIVATLVDGADYELGDPSTASVYLLDNESNGLPTVTIDASDPDASEPSDDGTFRITRQLPEGGSASEPLYVSYMVRGSATPDADYVRLSGSATIPAGQLSVDVDVWVLDDLILEPTETVVVELLDMSSYDLSADFIAVVDILDNELPPPPPPPLPTVTIEANDPNASEYGPDNGQFTVTRGGTTTGALVVEYTVTGSATPAKDYQQLSGSVTIPDGQASATINVIVYDDFIKEISENVRVKLSENGAYTLGEEKEADVLITDNEPEEDKNKDLRSTGEQKASMEFG